MHVLLERFRKFLGGQKMQNKSSETIFNIDGKSDACVEKKYFHETIAERGREGELERIF